MAWKVYIDRCDFNRRVRIRAGELFGDGSIAVFQPALLHKYAEGVSVPEDDHLLSVDADAASELLQALVDATWKFGVRPTGFAADRYPLRQT